MKVQKLKVGATIEVGDMVCHDSWIGKKWYKVVRTTAKYAVVAWSESATSKFPRIAPCSGFRPCGNKDIWSGVQYSAWRPAKEVAAVEGQEQPKEAGQ